MNLFWYQFLMRFLNKILCLMKLIVKCIPFMIWLYIKISQKSTKISAKVLKGGIQNKPRGIADKEVCEPLPEYE
jgi:hypothetical protein